MTKCVICGGPVANGVVKHSSGASCIQHFEKSRAMREREMVDLAEDVRRLRRMLEEKRVALRRSEEDAHRLRLLLVSSMDYIEKLEEEVADE